jgi:hypothetical protein
MTTVTSRPAPSTGGEGETEENTRSAAAARAADPPRHHPSVATGIRNGLVRTRTVRSNTVRALLKLRQDRGAATAEYIVATMAAVGFAGLLIVILRGDEVRGILTDLVRSALTVG